MVLAVPVAVVYYTSASQAEEQGSHIVVSHSMVWGLGTICMRLFFLQFSVGGGSSNCIALSSVRSGLKPCNIRFRFLVHNIMCTCLLMTRGINIDKALHLRIHA